MNAHVDWLRQSGETIRFHTHRRIKEETTGQHTYGALCLLHYITDGEAPARLIWALLFHDAAEQDVGDLPGPVKKDLGAQFADMFNERETAYLAEHGVTYALNNEERWLLKACDIFDGLFSCVEEIKRGNRLRAAAPYANYRRYAASMIAARLPPMKNDADDAQRAATARCAELYEIISEKMRGENI